MNHTALKFQSTEDFVAYTNRIDFDTFGDAVFVADGEVTGSFQDAKLTAELN